MLSIHTHTDFDAVSIPLEEWSIIKRTLEKVEQVEVIEDEQTHTQTKLVGLGNDVWDDIEPV